MFSDTIGVRTLLGTSAAIHVAEGEHGHAVYGPYAHVRPGALRVEFDLQLAAPPASNGDPVCAMIDVTAYNGTVVLTSRALRVSELGDSSRTFTLDFTLREFRTLEYRVGTAGTAAIVIAEPRLVRLGPVTGEAPPADPLTHSPDLIEQHRQVRAVLRLLRPHRTPDFAKVRLGNAGDGGYVCIDDFTGIDTALSLGINNDVSWDLDVADRGIVVHQFDHTVEDPAPEDPRMHFSRTMIAPETGPGQVSLSDLVRTHDKRASRPNMILKMDIEGSEWPVMQATPAADLARFAQIVCELHYFQGLSELHYRRKIFDSLSKLMVSYALVHVHANIIGGISNVGNVIFPNVIEATFANRAVYALEDSDELFPSPLDICCDPNQPDMYLGSFRF